jgi:hypothetical protein
MRIERRKLGVRVRVILNRTEAREAGLNALAKAGKLTREVLNDVAVGIVALTPAADLPKNFNLAK